MQSHTILRQKWASLLLLLEIGSYDPATSDAEFARVGGGSIIGSIGLPRDSTVEQTVTNAAAVPQLTGQAPRAVPASTHRLPIQEYMARFGLGENSESRRNAHVPIYANT